MSSPGNTSGHKADRVTTEKRIRAIQEWILQGYTSGDIVATVISSWNIGERQAKKYYRAAWLRFSEENKSDIPEKTAIHIARREKLFRDIKAKDTPEGARVALRILDSTAKIEGVIKPINVSVNQSNANAAQASSSSEAYFDNKKQYRENTEIIAKLKEIEKSI